MNDRETAIGQAIRETQERGELDNLPADSERGRLQDALYRLIQGREKMPLSPLWHNARRTTIFRYIERLQQINRNEKE